MGMFYVNINHQPFDGGLPMLGSVCENYITTNIILVGGFKHVVCLP
jgi:hypothetical protein